MVYGLQPGAIIKRGESLYYECLLRIQSTIINMPTEMGSEVLEYGDKATPIAGDLLQKNENNCNLDGNDIETPAHNFDHAHSDVKELHIFPDLADENDNLLLNEEGIPGIEEYLSLYLNDSQTADQTQADQLVDDEVPLYVNGKSVIRRHNTTGNRKFICSLCDKAFALKHNLEYHMVIHTGERAFVCGICKTSFALRHHLTQHMLTHADKSTLPMHKCNICGREFLQGYNLTRHLRVHSGEKRFPCVVCNKFFANSWSLQNHLMIHSDDKPYSCQICLKDFRKKCHLKRHLRTHANGKRAKTRCSKADHRPFSRRSTRLNTALTRRNRNSPKVCINKTGKFVCLYCDEIFPTQAKLKNHDCDYVATEYLERQTKKRNEAVIVDDDIAADEDDKDDVYIVSDDEDDDVDDDTDDESYVVTDDDDDESYVVTEDDDEMIDTASEKISGDDDSDISDDLSIIDCSGNDAVFVVNDDDGDDYDDFADTEFEGQSNEMKLEDEDESD